MTEKQTHSSQARFQQNAADLKAQLPKRNGTSSQRSKQGQSPWPLPRGHCSLEGSQVTCGSSRSTCPARVLRLQRSQVELSPGVLLTGAGGKDVFSGVEAAPHLLSSCWRRSTQERRPPHPHHPRGQREAHAGEGARPRPQVQPSLTRRIPEGRDLGPFCSRTGLAAQKTLKYLLDVF